MSGTSFLDLRCAVGCATHLEPDQPLRLISADGFEPQASVIGDSLAAACH